MGSNLPFLSLWPPPIVLTLVITTALMVGGRLGDLWLNGGAPTGVLRDWIFVGDPERAREVILAALELLAGICAISIAVVAMIVQLFATRYTSRVVDLFPADPLNILIFFANVVPLLHVFRLANTLAPGEPARIGMGIFMILATLATIVVTPYFKFVFYFLQPSHISETSERSSEKSLRCAASHPTEIARLRGEVSKSIRQVSDIALSSLAQSDAMIGVQCIDSIRQLAVYYLRHKDGLPESWFSILTEFPPF